ncbi:MAG: VOC family protein [Candidatus Longimicrobiales bacterium M2_2A_002]
MDELKTRGFHHITMVARDARRTVRFYGELLGLGLVKRTVNFDDPEAYHLYFGDDAGRPGTLLTFFEWPRSPKGHWGVGGVHHLALGVATEDAQLKWKRRLGDAGVDVTGPYDRGYFTSIYFTDPDGQILEIATAGPGYLIDESADELGRELQIPPERIMRGSRDEESIAALTWPEPVDAITPDMRLDGIHHISGITDDLELALDWYPATLGLDVIKRTVNRDDGETHHYFWGARDENGGVAPHSAWTLFGWRGSTYRARGGIGQTHHVAFRADDGEQQERWREHLQGMGVDVTPVLDRQYFRSIYFRAPDGQLLEIATDGPGFLIDEPEASLGTSLKLPSWLEPQRETIEPALKPLG